MRILLLLFSATIVELTSSDIWFQVFVKNVASKFHNNWRQHFFSENPSIRNRFKLTSNGTHYNSSDFIYPMILSVGSCLVHRNFKVARARYNSSITYVDLLNMNYDELPDDWSYENRATAQIACREVLRGVRQKRLFNRNFVETTSEKIHNAWIKRNANRTLKELILPYSYLSEIEKDKDRRALLIACRLFNELQLYRHFKTNPIHLIEPYIE
ncbi:unnamed protein product [Rotaria magnacalcarata]|uniref:Uncharacterized protein n=1 Tax=Rotaria magnacalcarata TaxID=392030 RepID=A0A816XZN2_9BILA|nr:unnamed protein product [Rotaria magnacalcarata]CAF1588544.1 unnamed protein product [Rotaria magnacalcarata]CAF2109844.1 unnamed protein product [Rotaria magnacalcarata]CAF2153087.1 unnamed protein product [Rotaria magnacalcarata]CAF2258141.1 unnamed protein product [Rotaria magnacalcarata]